MTLHTLLVSAFQVLPYYYTHQEDLVIGTMVNGRGHTEIEQVIVLTDTTTRGE